MTDRILDNKNTDREQAAERVAKPTLNEQFSADWAALPLEPEEKP